MIDLMSRRELFVDHQLLESLDGCELKLFEPHVEAIPRAGGVYNTVLHEGGRYRLYYRRQVPGKELNYTGSPFERVCCDESADGVNYQPLDMGTRGQANGELNNVIYDKAAFCHNFTPFIDTRPGVSADEKYKAISGIWHNNLGRLRDDGGDLPEDFQAGLYPFASSDGIHWRQTSQGPVIASEVKAFDSQNPAFWSQAEQCYVCYYRTWGPGGYEKGSRSIARATSPDFIHWSPGVHMQPNVAPEEFYTSQAAPYFRAPHFCLAFPTRYMRSRESSTDILFMSSRGGDSFVRTFRDALYRPGLNPLRWGNRANYASINIVPLSDEHMCIYLFTHLDIPPLMLRFRTDGIAGLGAGWQGGVATTRPFTFTGEALEVNYSTSAAGSFKAALLHEDGSPIDGFAAEDCEPLVGDKIAQTLSWRGGSLAPLVGRPVRLRFEMVEADLFSMRFFTPTRAG